MKYLTLSAAAALFTLACLPASAQITTTTGPASVAVEQHEVSPNARAGDTTLAGLPADGPVAVHWTDPAQFTEIRHSNDRRESERGRWLQDLAQHLRRSALRQLPQGERLDVTLTDIDLAGQYEPSHGRGTHDVRMLRETTPPMIELNFRHYDASGQLLAEGERQLRDLNYLSRTPALRRHDGLRHEKRLIDDWLRNEFAASDGR
ncbi:MAG: DUF3016 domain-containing protein [Xanthomonadales bacterium]|nr:DUF3016 domain-containing protein [Xanthomonadales bacterium]